MRIWVLAVGGYFLALPVLGAMGCLNDRETVRLEDQFRSSYVSAAAPGAAGIEGSAGDASGLPRRSEWSGTGIAVSMVGILMMLGAIKIARHKLAIEKESR